MACHLCRSSGFVSAVKTWLASGKGLVLSVDSSSVAAGTHTSVNGLLMEMGMSFFDSTWDCESTQVAASRPAKAQLGIVFLVSPGSVVGLGNHAVCVKESTSPAADTRRQ